ncbi:ABC transporter permease [Robertkochia marina]|uniref:ABC transporter permease n=1 Tax=Robertkochia marina TaxID=1227945 RepID=A0A4S3LWY8_9FLAO|nr:ABC transporter permease [Robertkochia marina]THD65694.1 ABC transporter permease [Robertkochia marina]TRZ46622.1 ABC transporter permease [Robertkochia marina]
MNNSMYLAWNYLKYHWGKTLLLVFAISMVIFIPLVLNLFANKGAERMMSRAVTTPLLAGSKGSATELTLSTLYFREPGIPPLEFREIKALENEGLARAIPLNLEYKVKEQPIVGTTTAYFDFRNAGFASGRPMAVIGECVLGASAAIKLNANTGDAVISSPAGAFDVAGSFPLKMKVTGVLKPLNTADDEAVFTDLKTAWVISGKAHGHDELTTATADSLLLSRSDSIAIASKAVLSYTEITPENINSFHFHGDPDHYPVNAIIAIPKDKKSELMLRGRYENEVQNVQIVVPEKVVDELLETVVSVKEILTLAAISIGAATLVITLLVFSLSIRLRKKEIQTLKYIGAAKGSITGILSLEIVLVFALSTLLTLFYLLAINGIGLPLLEQLIQ